MRPGPAGLEAIDWGAPWLAPWRGVGERVAQRAASGMPLHQALNREPGAPLQFVAAQELPRDMAYERFIADNARCPVRPGLHDFFNGLCWLQLARAKSRLNRLQTEHIVAHGVQARRGSVRDAITVFDENGALLDAPPPLWEALLARDWKRLFVDLRPLWDEARLLLVGHALLEKLVFPRKGMTAHVWRAQCPLGSLAAADPWLAGELRAERLAAKPFTPLPVLGVPGWATQNQDYSFYDDRLVFRPARAGPGAHRDGGRPGP